MPDYLNIAPEGHEKPNANSKGLNRYQKRLVHQLIRAEYPELVSISRAEFIQVVKYDKTREEGQVERKRRGLERTLMQQIGLRWVVEVICNNIRSVLPEKHWSPISSSHVIKDFIMSQPILNEAALSKGEATVQTLLQQTPMLVGHNLLLDLIYLLSSFFGPLPDRVEDFLETLATLFPLIVDTKYMADAANNNSSHYNSSLEDLDAELSKIPSATIGW